MDYTFERLRSKEAPDLVWMAHRAIETVISTVPECEGKPERAITVFPNLTEPAMVDMFRSAVEDPDFYFLIVRDEGGAPIAHSIFSLKTDAALRKYGSFYTRYVLPEHRRKGVASRMLEIAEGWFAGVAAEYLSAQTHVSNRALQALFQSRGYQVLGLKPDAKIPMLELRKDTG